MKIYKKFGTIIVLCNCIIVVASFNIKGVQANRLASTPAYQITFAEDFQVKPRDLKPGITTINYEQKSESEPNVIECSVIEREQEHILSKDDYNALLRIVEAEASGEDMIGKQLVANVVLNRVESEKFPNTVKEVIFQQSDGTTQFSPIRNGKYESVVISEETIEAVDGVLYGDDHSQGALFFAARKHADPSRMRWFDQNLTKLFDHGGHEFFV